jgi:glycosyltransferase involved in cell wall biosynthesis
MTVAHDRPALLVLTSTFPRWRGDAEPPFVYELARRLVDSFEVHVLAPHASGSRPREAMDGIQVHRFRYAPSRFERLAYQGGILGNLKKSPLMLGLVPFFLAAQLLAVLRLLRRSRIRLIHAHWIFPQGLLALLASSIFSGKVRVLITSHGGDLYGLKGPVFRQIIKWVAGGCDHLTVVSRAMRTEAMKLSVEPARVSVMPMGVDLQRLFVPPLRPAPAQSLLFVGRLVEKKGLRYLLEAMPKILAEFPEARLVVAGDGPCRRELEGFCAVLGIRERVEFLGAVRNEELPAVYQRSSIIVFPSVVSTDGDREGFGLVLVEALGCGCAAVASDLPAMTDIVENGVTALIVPQKRPDAIAAAVIRLLTDPELRLRLAQAGRRQVLTHFDWETISQAYRDLLGRLNAKALRV